MQVGARILDLLFVRERASRRETKLLNALLMVKSTLWKALFGKEADKLERANDDDKTYYIIEREPLVNRFISVPKDKVSITCRTTRERGFAELDNRPPCKLIYTST